MADQQNMRRENNGEVDLLGEVKGLVARNYVTMGINVVRHINANEKKLINVIDEKLANQDQKILEIQQKLEMLNFEIYKNPITKFPKLPKLPELPKNVISFKLIQIESVWEQIFDYMTFKELFNTISLVSKWFQSIVKIKKIDVRYYPKLESLSLPKFKFLETLIISRVDQDRYDHNYGIMIRVPNTPNSYRKCDDIIKQLPNLTDLTSCNPNTITDDGIQNLTKLKSLLIPKNITDNGLVRLTNLENLNIKHNLLVTDKSLSKLTKLKSLTIGCNRNITDSSVSRLEKLTYLHIRHNFMIKDGLWYMLDLKTLIMKGECNNFNTTSLKTLKNLTTLDLSAADFIIGDQDIMFLYKLTTLMIVDTGFISDKSLKNLFRLEKLCVIADPSYSKEEQNYDDGNISDASISKLPNLTYLNIEQSQKITSKSIGKLTKLQHLTLGNAQRITNASINKLVNLEYLHLTEADKIGDLAFKNLTKLKNLSIIGNNKVKGFENLYSVTSLEIENCSFNDGKVFFLSF